MEIDNVYNYDDNFIRSVGLGLTKTLSTKIRWINRFEKTKKRVVVDFYLSLMGDEEFILDAFMDDIVGTRADGLTNKIPRGIVSATNFSVVSSEFANPNQYIPQTIHINDKVKKIFSKLKAIPVNINFEIKIFLNSQLDIYTCWQKIMETLFNYHFFRIEYKGIPIECVLELPDDNTITMPTDVNISSDSEKTLELSLLVRTYLPTFQVNTEDLEMCDNDDDIDWERLGIEKPTKDYCDGLLSKGAMKRVYWYNIINNLDEYKIQRTKKDGRPDRWNKFNIS